MKTTRPASFAFLIFALTASTIASASDATGSFAKTLTVSGAAQIDVSTGSGNITVRIGDSNSVNIRATIKANDHWGWGYNGLSADERVKKIEANPPVEQSGNNIVIGKIQDEEVRNNVSISYELTVPASTRLESQTGSGSINIQSLQGPVKVSSGSGSIELGKIAGRVDAHSGSGHITLAGAEGDVSAHTGSGTIQLRGVNGGLTATTGSGNIEADGDTTGDWDLHTGSGSINVRTVAKSFRVDAESGSGGVNINRPITMQGAISRRHIEGSVGSGGPTLRLRTGSGHIEVE